MGLLAKLFGGRSKKAKPRRSSSSTTSKAAAPARRAAPTFSLLELAQASERRAELTPEIAERAERIAETALASFRSGRSDVPAMPSVASKVMGLVNDPNGDINEIVRLVNQDPGQAAQLLRVANSAAFGGEREVENTRDACVRLGTKTVGEIVSATALRASFGVDTGGANSCLASVGLDLWRRSLGVAHGAGWLAMRTRINSESLFLCGMLHNIGKAIGLRFFAEALDDSELGNDCLVHAALSRVNDDIGQAAAELWELPRQIGACCAYRLTPENPEDASVVHVIRVAAGLNDLRVDPWFADGLDQQVQASADAMGLEVFALRALNTELREAAERVNAMFG